MFESNILIKKKKFKFSISISYKYACKICDISINKSQLKIIADINQDIL